MCKVFVGGAEIISYLTELYIYDLTFNFFLKSMLLISSIKMGNIEATTQSARNMLNTILSY